MLRLDSALTAVPARGLQVSEAFITRQQRRDSELNIHELQITTHIDTADETVLSPMSNTDLFLFNPVHPTPFISVPSSGSASTRVFLVDHKLPISRCIERVVRFHLR